MYFLVGAKTKITSAEVQTIPSHIIQYWAENGNLRNPGLPFPMVPCLHQSNLHIKRKLRVWSVQKCSPLIGGKPTITCAILQTTQSYGRQYRAENGNFTNSESNFSHCTMFAPKQCLHEKEATCMESSKIQFSSRCKNCTYLCGTANDPYSRKAVQT